ncbi:MAG: carbohydrate ABC transporter permease [Actinobacteria bacterium]|nr:carbohydrate ABC transporter permease [Actinomycetota bacterium]
MSTVKIADANPGRKLFSTKFATSVVWIITVFWTVPTFGLFASSFRNKQDIFLSGWWNIFVAPNLTLGNYRAVLFGSSSSTLSDGVLPYLMNSIVITIPAVIFPVMIATMAAYCLAWVKFKGSDALFFFIFALQVVPIQMSLVPLLQLFTGGAHIGGVTIIPKLGIAGEFAGIWLPHTMFALPLAIYLLHNFIASLPRDLMEAAHVDGANHFKVFRQIVIPLSIPAIAAFAIFQFLWVWNDLLVALTFASGTEEVAPINVKLASLVGQWGSGWETLTAGAFVTIAIPLLVFFSLQRFFVRGLLAGSVK